MRLLTVSEVAEILKVSRARTYELIRRQLLPAVKVGRRQIRVSEQSLRDWISHGGSQL
jgi:excisionase family DNA binding protein